MPFTIERHSHTLVISIKVHTDMTTLLKHSLLNKDFRAPLERRLTAATAAITLAFLFVEMMCYVLKSGCTDESLLIKLW